MAVAPESEQEAPLLAAAARVVSEVGPGGLSPSAVAEEAGVDANEVVARFGSRREMLIAVARYCGEQARGVLSDVRERAGSPLEALVDSYLAFVSPEAGPDHVAHHLAFLQLDIADERLRGVALTQLDDLERQGRALIREAIAAGELHPCNEANLARSLQVAYSGGLLRWALVQEGSVRAAVRRDLKATLEPWRVGHPPAPR